MKKTLSLIFFIFCYFFKIQVQSQSIQLSFSLDTIYTTADQSETFTTISVKNISSSIINVRVDRISEVLATGHETYFCWDQCYPPGTSSSGGAIEINPGDSVLSFTAHVLPNGNEGSSEAVFLFSNEEATDDTVSAKFVFVVDKASDIQKVNDELFFLQSLIMANGDLNINFSNLLPQLDIFIYSAAGKLILQQSFQQAQFLTLNVGNIATGLYFIQLNTPTFFCKKKIMIVK